MATDTLSGSVSIIENLTLAVAGDGNDSGTDRLSATNTTTFTDGSGAGQASCWLSSTFNVAVVGSPHQISLADDVNPLGPLSTTVPTADPEGLKLRMLVITNNDASNTVTLLAGAGFPVTFITANTLIYPGATIVLLYPDGSHTLNDGVDDEIGLTAVGGTISVTMDVLYG